MGFDWTGIVRKVAPMLGTALGGPMGGLARQFIAEKLLGNPNASEVKISSAIQNATPEQLAKLKKIDNDFEIKMKELDIDVSDIGVEDRKRSRDLSKINIWPQIVLSSVFVVGYFGIMFELMVGKHLENLDNQAVFGVFSTIIGVLTAAVPQILSFWFGSSQGSREKTGALARK